MPILHYKFKHTTHFTPYINPVCEKHYMKLDDLLHPESEHPMDTLLPHGAMGNTLMNLV